MTDRDPVQIIRRNSRPMVPIPTGEKTHVARREALRAVLFDVYGTLFISGSGDIGTAAKQAPAAAFREAMLSLGHSPDDPDKAVSAFHDQIRREHEQGRGEGIEFPEVDVVDVWRKALEMPPTEGSIDFRRLAVEYEVRANPVWPMAGVKECLDALRKHGLVLGIVSNAQFFTPLLFPALLDATAAELGFADDLCFYSYQHRCAKPGEELYRMAAEALASRGIRAEETLYVGNDLLNDVTPAAVVGFRTALFAGDARSLRLRAGDARVSGVTPDYVLTELADLRQCTR